MHKKALSTLLAACMAVSLAAPAFAEDTHTGESAAAPAAEAAETVTDASISADADEAARLAEQQKLLDEVNAMTAGEDYKENCVLLEAESEELAAQYAAALSATVAGYAYGQASLVTTATVAETMQAALELPGLPLLYPNHIYKLDETVADADALLSSYSAAEAGATQYNDPMLSAQWHHSYIGSANAWSQGITGAGVTVAVIDTGIAQNHPDLKVSKYTDSMRYWSSEGGNTPYDTNGHGTQVAGIIAAIGNNGQGGVGIAPDVTLTSYKAANSNCIFYDDTISWAIQDAAADGADVINISCAFSTDERGWLANAIAYAVANNCVIVASAGNQGHGDAHFLPAHSNVIGVGALGTNGERLGDSNFGVNVDVMAPGSDLVTTTLDGGYTSGFGATSGSAAVATGVVALTICADSDLLATAQNGSGSLSQQAYVTAVQQRVYNNAQKIGDANYYGNGAVSVSSLTYSQPADPEAVRAFVTRLYEVCLDREPDAGGLSDWCSKLTARSISGTEAAFGFVFSQEFQNKNFCNEHYVMQLYRAFMGREYDEGGLAYWVNKLETGSTREEVFNGFAQSQEFTALCKEYSITLGQPVDVPQYGTVPKGSCSVCGKIDGVTAFVTRMYQVALSREPDAAGLADWTSRLWSHEASGRDIGLGFIFSEEFTNKVYDNANYVERLYEAFMGRASDEGGKADWVGRLNTGTSREDVFNGFAASQEFTNICNSYGIVRG